MLNVHESCDILERLLDYLCGTGFMDNDELEQYDEALTTIKNYIKINEGESHD
jgi:hypothetical protein